MYYAHTRKGDSKELWQHLEEHLVQTGMLAGHFANKFGAQQLGYIVGLLHDLGKYSDAFQEKLSGINCHVDHSTAGAKEVFALFGNVQKGTLAQIMSYVICGHHSGLPDAGSENREGSLLHRKIKSVNDYSAYQNEIQVPDLSSFKLPIKPSGDVAFSVYFFIKMLYACLVDADFIDTERYMDESKFHLRGHDTSMQELLDLFDAHMELKTAQASVSKINRDRAAILKNCLEKAQKEQGMFTLTVPTGGGKTLSSMAFALNHAVQHGMERIIYVIPYTSIIEQNAAVFKEIFGEDNILEHHSNFQFTENDDAQEISKKLALSAENWDIPIVVTTNVQFFESIFANRSSKSRKLHNLANSVIILDEAQMLPVKYLKPCTLALSELVKNYHSTVVLCTATQPNLNTILPAEINIQEIIDAPQPLYKKFKRTQIVNLGELDDESVLAELRKHPQVLCIVNTREHARQLYEKLIAPEDGIAPNPEGIYHLSTRMYPLHRRQVLEEIRQKLNTSKNGGEIRECKVISTQLIEAGVDVDFPAVYRALAGIDSIAQAAGRCNREGRAECANVYVFTPTEKHGQPPREIELNVSQAQSVFRNCADPLSLEGISKYFELLYDMKSLDLEGIVQDIKEEVKLHKGVLNFPFARIANNFKLIQEQSTPVIILADPVAKNLIEELKHHSHSPLRLFRKIQPYIVNIDDNEFKELVRIGGILTVDAERQLYMISDINKFYNQRTGVVK